MIRRPLTPFAALALLLAAAGATFAQGAALTDAEVRKIDKAQAKITLKHAEIKNLDMPPMTMVFRVKDSKVLDTLNPGDKVRFVAEKIDGQYVVTKLEAAK